MQNPRIVLILIATLFAAPLLLAVLMRSDWWDFRPSELSNRGTLVQPPVAAAALLGTEPGVEDPKWTILYRAEPPCAASCRADLAAIGQVWRSLGSDRERVIIRTLDVQGELNGLQNSDLPDLPITPLGGPLEAVRQTLADIAKTHGDPGASVFVLDPGTNIILFYGQDSAPGELREDLDRLLTWSAQD